MLEDTNIIVLMNMQPKTRTEFLRKTYLPGLKHKLRQFAKSMVFVPSSISSFSDLKYFTLLMRYGGAPPQEVMESIPDKENVKSAQDTESCTNFIRMYFDCGFIYTPLLLPILRNIDSFDLELHCTIYLQMVKYESNFEQVFEDYLQNFYVSFDTFRYKFLEHQIKNAHVCPRKLAAYLEFDLNHGKYDSAAIWFVLKEGLNDDYALFEPYFDTVSKIVFPKTDYNINCAISYFFRYFIERCDNVEGDLCLKFETLSPYYGYMATPVFKYEDYSDNNQWIIKMRSIILTRHKDLAFAFLLDFPNVLKDFSV